MNNKKKFTVIDLSDIGKQKIKKKQEPVINLKQEPVINLKQKKKVTFKETEIELDFNIDIEYEDDYPRVIVKNN